MVLLAAAVCTKQGKALLSRQFVEMSRARIEGLLAAFPKLMTGGKQHTFVETESVRYVYQPLERLYMLLITTKSSNILEDLETLRLFSRVIPEYCSSLDEGDVQEHVFDLLFAFDEIVALGYRESVNLAQIRTFTEMDSHEEKVFEAMRRSQEKEARDEMKRKAKELEMTRREERKTGRKAYTGGFGGGSGGGYGSSSMRGGPSLDTLPSQETTKSYNPAPSRSRKAGGGMQLGKKKKNIDNFVGQIEAEGEVVSSVNAPRQVSSVAAKSQPQAQQESVHLKISEKLSLVAGRDGGLQSMEVLGMIMLRISDPALARVRLVLANNERRNVQFQTHPNVDKALFNDESILGLKQAGKSFPANQDVGVLKWRLATSDVSLMPLTINCWPSENGGKCDVNIEYELQQDYLELQDVVITIPIPSGVGAPVVGDMDGEYNYDSKKHVLDWRVSVIDQSNKTGSMEFTVPGIPEDFFPIKVYFISTKSYCHIEVGGVSEAQGGGAVKFSSDVIFTTEKFEIV